MIRLQLAPIQSSKRRGTDRRNPIEGRASAAGRIPRAGQADPTTRTQNRLFLLFLSVINLIAAVLVIIIHTSVADRLKHEARNTYSAIVQQAAREVEAFAHNSLFYLGMLSMDEQVQDLLAASQEEQLLDRLRLLRMQQTLKRLKIQNQYIRSVYFFKFQPPMVLSDRGIYSNVDDFSDHELFRELAGGGSAGFTRYSIRLRQIPERAGAPPAPASDLLTLILPINIPKQEGALVLDLEVEWFRQVFARTLHTIAGETHLYLEGNQRVASASPAGAPPRLSAADAGSAPDGLSYLRLAGRPYLLFSYSGQHGLTVLHAVEESAIYRSAAVVQDTITVLWIAVFLLSIPFAVRLQKMAYRPIGRLYAFLKDNHYIPDEASVRGEVEMLMQTYRRIADTNLIYRRQLAGYRPLFNEMLLMNILMPNRTSFLHSSPYRRVFLSRLTKPCYQCLILKIDDFGRYARERSVDRQSEDSAFMLRVIESHLPEVKTVSHLLEDRIVMLYPCDGAEEHDPQLDGAVQRIKEAIEAHLEFTVTIAVGERVAGIQNAGSSYRTAESALEHKFIQGRGRVIRYGQIRPRDTPRPAGDEALKRLQAAIRVLSYAKAEESLKEALSAVVPRQHVKEAYAVAATRILAVLEQALDRRKLDVPSVEEVSRVIEQSETVSELEDWFLSIIHNGFRQIESFRQTRNLDHVERVKVIIEEQYLNPLLQISDVAEKFNLNPTYFGRFFHELTGTSFTAHVSNVRLNHAAGLLHSTDLSINEIAEKTGFNSTQYFIRVFKKRYRTTPGEYRQRSGGPGRAEGAAER